MSSNVGDNAGQGGDFKERVIMVEKDKFEKILMIIYTGT